MKKALSHKNITKMYVKRQKIHVFLYDTNILPCQGRVQHAVKFPYILHVPSIDQDLSSLIIMNTHIRVLHSRSTSYMTITQFR